MTPAPLSAAARRALLHCAAGLGATATSRLGPPAASTPPDRLLPAACPEFNGIERTKPDLVEAAGRVGDGEVFNRLLDRLGGEQRPALDATRGLCAATLDGHRGRAINHLLWDGGEALQRRQIGRSVEDRPLAALVRGLTGVPRGVQDGNAAWGEGYGR